MANYHSRRHSQFRSHRNRSPRHSSGRTGPLIAFILVASFGILFAGCTPKEKEPEVEEFTFTAEDVEKFRDMVRTEDEEVGEVRLAGTGVAVKPRLEEGEGDMPPVLDLSMVKTYDAIRSGPGGTGEDLYRVTNEFLNVRSEPGITASIVERLLKGATMTVLEFVDAAWAKVQLPNGKEGYVAHRYIAKLTSEDNLAEEKKAFEGLYFVDFGFLNVRKESSAQSEKLGELAGQAIVRPLSMDEVWARIPFEGKEGYVAVQYLSPFLPNFLVRQDRYTLPILHYRLVQEGMLDALVKHVDLLQQEGVTIITLKDFYDLLLKQEERDVRLDPKTVVLAISDIGPENVKEVSDVLRASNVQATLFIQTRHVGMSGITEKAIMTFLANGHDLQSGGHTGDDLRSLTNAQVELELAQSRALIEELTKKPVFAIGFPRGGVNDRVAHKASEAGYLLGLSSAPERTFTREQFLRLPSFIIATSMTDEDVLRIAKGE